MKKICTLAALVLLSVITFAQESKISKSYVTKTSVVVYPYSPETEKPDKSIHFLLNDGIKFYVYKVLDSGYVISVWDFNETDDKTKFLKEFLDKSTNLLNTPTAKKDYYKVGKTGVGLKADAPADTNSPFAKYKDFAYVDFWGNNMQFFIPLKEFNDNCEPIYPQLRKFTWGFLTLPIKVRFDNDKGRFSIEEKINFGLSLGARFQQPSTILSAHNALAGVAISNVRISDNASAAALSLSAGYMYQYDLFQVGIFTGFDFVGGGQASQFNHQGKPWIGFAIGVSLFGENKTSAGTSSAEN
jgi:hypothetical protein